MKHIVSDHAVAIGSPYLYKGNDGIEQTEMQMYQCGNTGILFALDCAWLDDECDHADTMEIPLAIPSFVMKELPLSLWIIPTKLIAISRLWGKDIPMKSLTMFLNILRMMLKRVI